MSRKTVVRLFALLIGCQVVQWIGDSVSNEVFVAAVVIILIAVAVHNLRHRKVMVANHGH